MLIGKDDCVCITFITVFNLKTMLHFCLYQRYDAKIIFTMEICIIIIKFLHVLNMFISLQINLRLKV